MPFGPNRRISGCSLAIPDALRARTLTDKDICDQPVDLLLSDVIMPGGMNGVQLTVEARRIRPELKVLLTSGYTAAALTLEHGLPDNLNVVEKPYRREELAKKLRLVIGG